MHLNVALAVLEDLDVHHRRRIRIWRQRGGPVAGNVARRRCPNDGYE